MSTFESQEFAGRQRALASEREIEGADRLGAGIERGVGNFFQTSLAMREAALRERQMAMEEVQNQAAMQEHQGRMQEMNARLQAIGAVSEISLRKQALRAATAEADLAEAKAKALSPSGLESERAYEIDKAAIERSISAGTLKRTPGGRLVQTTPEDRRRMGTEDPARKRITEAIGRFPRTVGQLDFARGTPAQADLQAILDAFDRGEMTEEAARAAIQQRAQRQPTSQQNGAPVPTLAAPSGDTDFDAPVTPSEVPFTDVLTIGPLPPPEVQQKWLGELLPALSAWLPKYAEERKRNGKSVSRADLIQQMLRDYRAAGGQERVARKLGLVFENGQWRVPYTGEGLMEGFYGQGR